jgi:hypothetical protein
MLLFIAILSFMKAVWSMKFGVMFFSDAYQAWSLCSKFQVKDLKVLSGFQARVFLKLAGLLVCVCNRSDPETQTLLN